MKRKEFIKVAGIATAGVALSNASFAKSFYDVPKVRLGIIGVGLRGQEHLDLVLRRNDTELIAIADIDDRMLTRSKEIINKSGKKNATNNNG